MSVKRKAKEKLQEEKIYRYMTMRGLEKDIFKF
jgi:hypothetical protein